MLQRLNAPHHPRHHGPAQPGPTCLSRQEVDGLFIDWVDERHCCACLAADALASHLQQRLTSSISTPLDFQLML